jgi:Protein of unknown function (DUF3223)
MGRARRIALETRVFEKAGDATSFFSAMLNRYSVGAYVSDADAKDLMALLKRHNERDEKIGPGIDHFEVDAAPDGHTGKCFWIVRTDSSRIDFSYKHCLQAQVGD